MQEAAAWAGPRFQLTHSAAKGSGERVVLCSDDRVLLGASKTQLPSVAQGQCQGLQTGRKDFCNLPSSSAYLPGAIWEWHLDTFWDGNADGVWNSGGGESLEVPSSSCTI